METQIRSFRVPGTMGKRGYHAVFDGDVFELTASEMEAILIMVIARQRREDGWAEVSRFLKFDVVPTRQALRTLIRRLRLRVDDSALLQLRVESAERLAYRLAYGRTEIVIASEVIDPGMPYINPSILAELANAIRDFGDSTAA